MAGGRGTRSARTLMQAIFREINKPRPEMAYIGAASGDDKTFFGFIGNMIKSGGDCTIKQVLLSSPKADINLAKQILQNSDAIFMSGGDVEAGMQVLQERQLVSFIQELSATGKLFFGASAGSIMLAEKWVRWTDPEDDSSAELFPCLGIAPVICDTHAEKDDWEELKWALKLEKAGVTGYGIPTGSCLKITPNHRLETLGGPVARFHRKKLSVERMEDLLPENSKT